MFLNVFRGRHQCSQPGESMCRDARDCLKSCPYGDIPASRMGCQGTPTEKHHGLGRCAPAWSEVGDPCVVGPGACAPSSNGYNDLYCQQNQLAWPNYAPGYHQQWVGNGTCQRRTLATSRVGADSWRPGVRGADYAHAPVYCTNRYLHHLATQGLLQCDNPADARDIAKRTCSNVLVADCQQNQVVMSLTQ